ncbi:hypothetical protein SLEP1_g6668 [Rubroshorea leprosula]|uniref:Homeobox-DDT domain protein RLT2 n=1 Tax=Rubroshorea leprosula TaxID=152421 RepID=A0AAV5I1U4_9ROSI|nr:hypothetical protein SLEP1_g6668 [Rubroshorea leprosula]
MESGVDGGGSGGGGGGGGGVGLEGEKKKPLEGETKVKRKMKTASQLEILEKTYAMENYPSEASRAELSVQLGLSDRQLQMWFCHRRLKDRKTPPAKRQRKDSSSPAAVIATGEEVAGGEAGNELASGSSPFGHSVEPRRVFLRPGVAVPRYYETPQTIAEFRAIAFVEAQLGEPLKEDGPILGMEFDPLPPGAFGAPIGASTTVQHDQPGQPFETKLYERPDAKAAKGTVRALHEYQFLPEQPTMRNDTHERVAPSYHYGSPADAPNARGRTLVHENEHMLPTYGVSGHMPNLNLLPQQARKGNVLPTASVEYDNASRRNSFTNTSVDANIGTLPIAALESPFVSSDRRSSLDEDTLRVERKRKSEEARIAREVEAHEKRIRKELEKQDILRRKREEQLRKEKERRDRERRKEEERLLRDKQREEERYLREQRRELERREKFLMKESMRAEKMRQKEELRKEKELARLKAANERAIARRLAKESMELIDDERLELMELAASSKGLPSTLSLDFETLQNLDLFRVKLCKFPPKTVQLKRPFSVQPWDGSEENIGDLLMVWRFLITFADILGLWPFTLDEFVQAFHDYDPRLLGEIHVALLRSIIKDIEDVARTPSLGLGTNQNNAANPGGGHPQIVEGAYAWGFDIRSWQRHLSVLTWPEILRQFALSAGFGPQLKKRNIEQAYLHDDNEGNDGQDIVSNLRNGAAAENAVAIMQERGFGNQRRSRHCLTPGTVKFAAFHVLSLEGSRGLTILEVAEKIQKSGLRDLTTSKTPEASIAAALSRDTKLFERTAPSTYCVRSPYRKDPADAESILSSAKERVRIFKSGLIGEDAEDAERDDDSESDIAEHPEADDLGAGLKPKKEAYISQGNSSSNVKTTRENGNKSVRNGILEASQGEVGNRSEELSSTHPEGFNEVKDIGALNSIDAAVIHNDATNVNQEDTDIDESNPGEPWVQGLMEGEYTDLSVEERLNALVTLIGVAIEGNSVRVVLEERLEAANALKKQMWVEAQLDKRRLKEEFVVRTNFSSHVSNKIEPSLTGPSAECRESLLITACEKNIQTSLEPTVQQERLNDPQNDHNYLNNMPPEGSLLIPDISAGPDNLPYHQSGYAAERSRLQLKSYIGHKAEEMYVHRSLPLGQDRRRNRYWQFITSTSLNDPGCGRIFVELHDGRWRLIDTKEGFDALLAFLDVRGVRESHLHSMLQKIEVSFREAVRRNELHGNVEMQNQESIKIEANQMVSSRMIYASDSDISETSTSFQIELGRNEKEKRDALKRYEDFEKWMWVSSTPLRALKYGKKRCKELLGICDYCHGIYFYEDNHCQSCHETYGASKSNLYFTEHAARCSAKLQMDPISTLDGSVCSPLRMKLLKVQLALVEVSVPSEALQPFWTDGSREAWGVKLHSSTSVEELLQMLTLLEESIKRDYLSSLYETTSELLPSSNPSDNVSNLGAVTILPWIPQTTAAVALRLSEFDASISYTLDQRVDSQEDKGVGEFMLRSKHVVAKSTQDDERLPTPYQAKYLQEENWVNAAFSGSNRGRGRGKARGRTTRGRSQRRVSGPRSESGKRHATESDELVQVLGWKGQSRGRGGRKRGRRSTRSRPKPAKKVVQIVNERDYPKEITEKSSGGLEKDDWNGGGLMRSQAKAIDNPSSSGRSEYSDENGQASGDEYDDLVADDYARHSRFNDKSDDLDASDYNVDGDEDDEYADDVAEDEQWNFNLHNNVPEDKQGNFKGGYMNENSDEEGIRDGDGQDSNPYPKQYGYSTEASSDFSE